MTVTDGVRTLSGMTPAPNDERVELRVPSSDLDRWRATAEAEGRSLSNWIRHVCNSAATIDPEFVRYVNQRAKAEERAARKKGSRR